MIAVPMGLNGIYAMDVATLVAAPMGLNGIYAMDVATLMAVPTGLWDVLHIFRKTLNKDGFLHHGHPPRRHLGQALICQVSIVKCRASNHPRYDFSSLLLFLCLNLRMAFSLI